MRAGHMALPYASKIATVASASFGWANFWFGRSDSVSCWNNCGDSVPLFTSWWRKQRADPEEIFEAGEKLRCKPSLADWLGIWTWAVRRASDAVLRSIGRYKSDHWRNAKIRVVTRVQR